MVLPQLLAGEWPWVEHYHDETYVNADDHSKTEVVLGDEAPILPSTKTAGAGVQVLGVLNNVTGAAMVTPEMIERRKQVWPQFCEWLQAGGIEPLEPLDEVWHVMDTSNGYTDGPLHLVYMERYVQMWPFIPEFYNKQHSVNVDKSGTHAAQENKSAKDGAGIYPSKLRAGASLAMKPGFTRDAETGLKLPFAFTVADAGGGHPKMMGAAAIAEARGFVPPAGRRVVLADHVTFLREQEDFRAQRSRLEEKLNKYTKLPPFVWPDDCGLPPFTFNLVVRFTPCFSPELNPIELLWARFKWLMREGWYRDRAMGTKSLPERSLEALRSIGVDLIQKYFRHTLVFVVIYAAAGGMASDVMDGKLAMFIARQFTRHRDAPGTTVQQELELLLVQGVTRV